jgi:hypothetical protein
MERAVNLSPETAKLLNFREGAFAYFRKEYVQVFKASGQKDLFRVDEILQSPFSQKESSGFLKKLAAANITSLNLILSRDFFVSKRVLLPAADFREAKKMALMKLPRLSPYAPDDSVAEVSFVSKKDSDYTSINLWIISRKILYKYLYLMNKAGIMVSTISLDIDGLPSLWAASQKKESCFMAVLNDQSCMHLLIIRDRSLLHSRMVSHGLTGDAEACRGAFLKECENFIRYVREEYPDETPEKILVIQEQTPFLLEPESIGSIPVEKAGWASLGIAPSENYMEFPVQAVTSGLGLGSMNFITDKYKSILSHMAFIKKGIKVISMVIIFTLCLFVTIAIRYSKKSDQIARLQDRLNEIEKESSSIKVLQRRILYARNIQKSQAASLDVLSALIPLVQGSMRLSSFSMDENNQVGISGHAETLKDVNAFTGELMRQPSFQKVKQEPVLSMKLDNRDVYTFKINFHYMPYPEEE